MKELAFLLRLFFGAVLHAFFPAAFAEAKKSLRDTAEDALPQPELKARLQRRIRDRWRGAAVAGVLTFACLAGSGCGTKAIFVQDGEPVRLREPVKNAAVWVLDAEGRAVASTVDLPAGWYVVADPGDPPAEPTNPSDPPLGIRTPYDIPVVPGIPAPAPLIPLTPKPEETELWPAPSTPNPTPALWASRSPAPLRPSR